MRIENVYAQLELPGMPDTDDLWAAIVSGDGWGKPLRAAPTKWRRCSWCQKNRAATNQEFCMACLMNAGRTEAWAGNGASRPPGEGP